MKSPEPAIMQYVPTIRSGSFADIGPRRYMEDQHIKIDDLSMHLGSHFRFPSPNAFYGVLYRSLSFIGLNWSVCCYETDLVDRGTGI